MSSIVVDTSVGLDVEWDNYARCHALGTICHLSAWRNLISGLFGHQTYYLSIRSRTNQVIGILPLVRLKSLLFGDFMISMPYLNYELIYTLFVFCSPKRNIGIRRLEKFSLLTPKEFLHSHNSSKS